MIRTLVGSLEGLTIGAGDLAAGSPGHGEGVSGA
jgi:hypothetical protein